MINITDCGFQEPKIDSRSTEGLKPEKFESDIVFDDVHFAYPARPDVQVNINFCRQEIYYLMCYVLP